jgi:hypothetical protein
MSSDLSEIKRLFESPEWWFSTIVVGLIVNIISSLIYDQLKQWLASLPRESFLIACQIVFAILIFASSMLMRPDDFYLRNVLPAAGALLAFGVLLEIYLRARFRLIVMLTTMSIFCSSVILQSHGEHPDYSIKWLATLFFCSLATAAAITTLTQAVLLLRERRRELRDYRD